MGILRRVEIPPGVDVTLEESVLTVTGPKGTLTRNMRFPQIDVALEDGEVVVSTTSDKKRFLAMSGTREALAKSMIQGVVDGYEYRMKVVYSHFPIQLKLQGNRLEINNFLGEKQPRVAKILEVSPSNRERQVILTGIDRRRWARPQTSNRDQDHEAIRVFQDGIYITEGVKRMDERKRLIRVRTRHNKPAFKRRGLHRKVKLADVWRRRGLEQTAAAVPRKGRASQAGIREPRGSSRPAPERV